MVTWREEAASSPAAVELLTEYFENRALTFPGGPDRYTTKFPDAAQFVPPRGVFLVAEVDGADVGCGGIRELEPGRFEVKHLYLRPSTRGRGFGRLLLEELERRALDFGGVELVLDTNDNLAAAGGLYRSSGFATIPPYNDNPNATTWYAKPLAG